VPLDIRLAASHELAAVADLCVAAYAPFVADDSHYIGVLRDVERRAAEAELLVATVPAGGRVLGTVTFVPDGGPLGEIARPSETEFRMLAVDPDAQGHGVGKALLRRVLADSADRGNEAVVCSSLPTMRAAHRIYAQLGFRRMPERDWSPVPGVDLLAFAHVYGHGVAYSVVNVDELEGAGPGGAVRFVRRALGVEAFGINWFELPPGGEGREHDETASQQEEVSVVVRGSGHWRVDGAEVPVRAGSFIRFDPGTVRCPVAGPDGMTFVAVGARRGAYDPRGPF
jgi:GNAT superfamily N-acetyltransferase/quercetin dioxygenase-like cupin family protein